MYSLRMVMRLIRDDDPILSQYAAEVNDPKAADVQELIDFMWATLRKTKTGVGLAANQVGVARRVFILDNQGMTDTYVNPVIEKKSKNGVWNVEQCLSCPGLHVKVLRSKQVTIRALDRQGRVFKRKLRGLPAVIAQHEIDHLNGITLRHRLDGRV